MLHCRPVAVLSATLFASPENNAFSMWVALCIAGALSDEVHIPLQVLLQHAYSHVLQARLQRTPCFTP